MSRNSTARFLLTRLRDGIVVLLLVVAVIFVLGHVVGDPAKVMAPVDATDEQLARLRTQLGLDRPFLEQFVSYFWNLLRGDFGMSLWQDRPALEIVLERLGATILLTATALVIAAIFGSLLGLVAGAYPDSALDRVTNVIAITAISVPNFWLGLLLIVIVAVQLGWLPTSGYGGWQHLVLPAVTLATVHFGRIFQLVRSATFEEAVKPYVTVARSKGLPERTVLWKHVFRNAGVTIATVIGWEYVRMLGGAAFAVEVVFAWPGIGLLMITASQRQDFPLLQAAVIVAGMFVIVTNALVDLAYRAADPRLKVA